MTLAVKAFTTLAAVTLLAGCMGYTGTPVPPCPEEWTPGPDGSRCVPFEEACHGWFQGTADERVSCEAESPDGNGFLRVELHGEGRADVTVTDGRGTVIYSDAFHFSGSILEEHLIAGDPGTWTLTVNYRDAMGSGRVNVWG
jgi:hypothetical protein